MKNIFLTLFIATFLITCKAQKTASISSEAEVTALGEKFQKMHSDRLLLLEKGEVANAVSCYSEDAYLMDIGAAAKGRDNIQKHLEAVLSSMSLNNTKNVQEGLEVSGNLAYDYGSTTMRLDFEITGESLEVKSKYICIWKKNEKGEWLISKLIFNQDDE